MSMDSRKRVFVGDIQGCLDELEDLLAELRFDPATHALFAVGDLVNRGPKSLETLRYMRSLGADSVLGNHDLHLLAIASGQRKLRKGDTLQEILDAPDRDELIDWLRTRPLILEWDDIVLVHAGLHPKWTDYPAITAPLEARIRAGDIPFDDPDLEFMTMVRHTNKKGRRPGRNAKKLQGFKPWNKHYKGDRLVVCGHWAMRGLVVKNRLRSLDTGCVWGGDLTAWVAEDDLILSVPAHQMYRDPDAS